MLFAAGREHSFESDKKAFDVHVGESLLDEFRRAAKFILMMFGLALAIAFERRQSAVGSTIGMAHQVHAWTLVEQNGHANLLENEIALEVVARRCQRLRAARNNDHVGTQDSLLLEKFLHRVPDALVEAAEHRGVGNVLIGRGVEMEDFAHGLTKTIYPSKDSEFSVCPPLASEVADDYVQRGRRTNPATMKTTDAPASSPLMKSE